MQEVQSQEYVQAPDLDEQLEALLAKHYRVSPFTCSVGLSADGLRYAAVGIKLHGDSTHRKGRWTRCTIAASCPVEQGVAGLVAPMRKLYAEYATLPHRDLNTFRPRRRHTRSMRGK